MGVVIGAPQGEGGDVLAQARAAYARRDWAGAVRRFQEAVAMDPGAVPADDLFALADAAWWVGEVEASVAAGESAYRRYLQGDRPQAAAMAAMTVAVNLLGRGDVSLGSGWMARAVRLVADQPDTSEHQYLRYLTEVEAMIDGAASLDDPAFEALVARARDVRQAGERLGIADLVAAATVAQGRILLKRGRAGEAVGLLDEAMVCLVTEDLAPDWAGSVYCHLMAACQEVGDLARAREWTDATERWLDTIPPAVLFRGICRVHRSQVLQVTGAWDRAEIEAARVCEDLAGISPGTAAEGRYQLGELRRLRGDVAGAEDAYQRAHQGGRDPQPGLALLRLMQGRTGVALSLVRAALVARGGDALARFPVRVAQVEISLAAGELAEAVEACAEVEATARTYRTSGFEAEALGTRGAVDLAAGRPEQALPVLREACRRWRELGADFHAARVCLLLAQAYDALGAGESARLERAAAATVFDRLGVPDGARTGLSAPARRPLPDGLTAREAEVLSLVAAGRSNHDVALALVISEKTVARHLSNIFVKIGVASRTEAAAYAFRHGLVVAP